MGKIADFFRKIGMLKTGTAAAEEGARATELDLANDNNLTDGENTDSGVDTE